MRKNERGFGAVEILLVIVVIGLIGAVSYLFITKQKTATDSNSTTTKATTTDKKDTTQTAETSSDYTPLQLASNTVTFSIPKTWLVEKGKGGAPATSSATSIEAATLTPPEKKTTIYGGGTEYFNVNITVFDNSSNTPAQKWFTDIYGAGSASDGDKTSNTSINAYDTYYFEQINNSYDEINYAISHNGKIAVITARISEKGYDASGNVNDQADFTEYVPAITKIANSIKLN